MGWDLPLRSDVSEPSDALILHPRDASEVIDRSFNENNSSLHVLETDFSAGRNFLNIWTAFRTRRYQGLSKGSRLRLVYFGLEARPWRKPELCSFLSTVPGDKKQRNAFIHAYPDTPTRGWHAIELDEGTTRLVLCFDEPEAVFPELSGRFDLGLIGEQMLPPVTEFRPTWFLDKSQLLTTLSCGCIPVKSSSPVARRQHNVKAHASIPGTKIHIEGAGISASCLAEAGVRRNLSVTMHDPANGKPFASGNAAALVEPRLTADRGPVSTFNVLSFLYASRFYDRLQARSNASIWIQTGVRIVPSNAYKPVRMRKIADMLALADPSWFQDLGSEWYLPTAGSVDPLLVLKTCRSDVVGITNSDKDRSTQGETAATIHAMGPCRLSGLFADSADALIPSRGAISRFRPDTAAANMNFAVCGAGYLIQNNNEFISGATFRHWCDVSDASWDETTPDDVAHNLAQALTLIRTRNDRTENKLKFHHLGSRASLRATTRDRWPLAGLHVSGSGVEGICTGFGSRGFTYAPIVADQMICQLIDEPGPIPKSLWDRMSPFRFI